MLTPQQEATVTIPRHRLEELLEVRRKLTALESAGVDNWEGYADAMAPFFADEEE